MQTHIDNYINWLREKISYKQINDWYEINTPFLNRFNDYIQIYVKKDNGSLILTDNGETINNLELSGVDFNTEKRKKELAVILNGFGVHLKGAELSTKATANNFPTRKHGLIQAILSVDDLFVLAQAKVSSFFLEDVKTYLTSNEVRFSSNIILEGKSTFQHKFDVLIPASTKEKERIVKVVNAPKKQNIITHLFAFEDTQMARDNEGIIVLNDTEISIPSDISDALTNYNIVEFPWSRREELKYKLTG